MVITQAEYGCFTFDYIVCIHPESTFGRVGNKHIAIISDTPLPDIHEVVIEQEVKRQLYKVDMCMGKGYIPTKIEQNRYRFIPDRYPIHYKYEVYRVLQY